MQRVVERARRFGCAVLQQVEVAVRADLAVEHLDVDAVGVHVDEARVRVEVALATPRRVLDLGAGLVRLRRVPTEDHAAVLHERGVVVVVELRREVLLHLVVAHVHVRVGGDDPFGRHRGSSLVVDAPAATAGRSPSISWSRRRTQCRDPRSSPRRRPARPAARSSVPRRPGSPRGRRGDGRRARARSAGGRSRRGHRRAPPPTRGSGSRRASRGTPRATARSAASRTSSRRSPRAPRHRSRSGSSHPPGASPPRQSDSVARRKPGSKIAIVGPSSYRSHSDRWCSMEAPSFT